MSVEKCTLIKLYFARSFVKEMFRIRRPVNEQELEHTHQNGFAKYYVTQCVSAMQKRGEIREALAPKSGEPRRCVKNSRRMSRKSLFLRRKLRNLPEKSRVFEIRGTDQIHAYNHGYRFNARAF
jgi:hypothetical protein